MHRRENINMHDINDQWPPTTRGFRFLFMLRKRDNSVDTRKKRHAMSQERPHGSRTLDKSSPSNWLEKIRYANTPEIWWIASLLLYWEINKKFTYKKEWLTQKGRIKTTGSKLSYFIIGTWRKDLLFNGEDPIKEQRSESVRLPIFDERWTPHSVPMSHKYEKKSNTSSSDNISERPQSLA